MPEEEVLHGRPHRGGPRRRLHRVTVPAGAAAHPPRLDAMTPLLPPSLVTATSGSTGFNWIGLVVLVAVVAVVWPFYKRLRDHLSRERRERWAREEGWEDTTTYTPENDPDLKRD